MLILNNYLYLIEKSLHISLTIIMLKKLFTIFFILSLIPCTYSQSCLNYSTFFGKLQFDEVRGVCTDLQKNVYVIGNTYNTDLPVTAGAFQSTAKGNYEAFLAKLDSCGNLVWCTYLGTSGFDSGEKITYSNDNTIVFCGYTDGADLSTTSGCFQAAKNGDYDSFIGKFTLSGTPVWLTYFGVGQGDFSFDVVTDTLSNIIIGGTSTSNAIYTNSNSFQQFQAGGTDAFIARFNKNGNLKFSTFFGGSGAEDIHALATDKNCNIIGVGGSFSFNLNTSPGCYQPASNGGMEIYVLKLDSSGQRIFSTYIGEAGTDDAYGLATDKNNFIYISGHTNSAGFYTSPGAYQSVKSGQNDCYCLSLSPSGSMQWSTFLGGSSNDFLNRMHINSNKELVILLNTQSTNFPMLGAGTTTVNNGSGDAAVIKLSATGIPFWSSYVGGTSAENPHDIASFSKDKIVLVGSTSSADFPLSATPYQNTFNGTEDAFITCKSVGFFSTGFYDFSNESTCKGVVTENRELHTIRYQSECFDKWKYEVYDLTGKNLQSGEMFTNENINVAGLSDGMYFLNMEKTNGRQTLKYKFIVR